MVGSCNHGGYGCFGLFDIAGAAVNDDDASRNDAKNNSGMKLRNMVKTILMNQKIATGQSNQTRMRRWYL